MKINRVILFIAFLMIAFLCKSCFLIPIALVEQLDSLEEAKIKNDSTYKRIYLSGSNRIASADDFFAEYGKQIDSIASVATVGKSDSNNFNYDIRTYPTYYSITLSEAKNNDKKAIDLKFDIINVDDSNYPDEIKIRALVYDNEGKYISGLAHPYLSEGRTVGDYWKSVHDSCRGVNNEIEKFDVVEVREKEAQKHAIAFALDHSPSMGSHRIARLQIAVQRLLRAIKPGDAVAIVKFDSKLHTEVDLTYEMKSAMQNFIVDSGKSGKYGGGTALFDAANHGISLLNKADDSYKKVLIAFSDGQDNSSKSKIDSLLRFAKASNVEIYSIAYGAADKSLETMAEYTGGRMYRTLSSNEFPFIFRDIYLLLKNYYLISYRPPECDNLHKVNVKLGSADGRLAFDASGQYDRSVFQKYSPVGTIAIMNIEFDFGSDKIEAESYPMLDKISDAMKNNPNIKILVTGHTDDIGSNESNLALSVRRAASVKAALVQRGITPDRIKTVGKGESMPIAPNNSEENRRINRRTEFTIIEN
ncbi:MAG: OmpA family protein [Desulfobulbaceae bacterium]|nr:OmpA family protein [Desulfobulbaceae bacterium]